MTSYHRTNDTRGQWSASEDPSGRAADAEAEEHGPESSALAPQFGFGRTSADDARPVASVWPTAGGPPGIQAGRLTCPRSRPATTPCKDGTEALMGATHEWHARFGDAPFLGVDLGREIESPRKSSRRSEPETVQCLDAETLRVQQPGGHPRIRWQACIGDVSAQAVVGRDMVFVPTGDGLLHALSHATGFEQWRVAIGKHASAPVLHEDIVFVTGGDRLYALDAANGDEVWSATTGPRRPFTSCVVHGDVLYVGNHDGFVYAVDVVDGEPYWSTRIGARMETSPAVTDDLIFARSSSGSLHALDTTTGEIVWSRDIGWTFEPSAPAAAGDIVVVSAPGGLIAGLGAGTGVERWRVQVSGIIASPLVANNASIVVPTTAMSSRRATIVTLNAETGSVIWWAEMTNLIAGTLGLSDMELLAGGTDGVVRGIDLQTGAEVWSFSRPDGLAASSPVVSAGALFVGTRPTLAPAAPRMPLQRTYSDRPPEKPPTDTEPSQTAHDT